MANGKKDGGVVKIDTRRQVSADVQRTKSGMVLIPGVRSDRFVTLSSASRL